MAITQPIFKLGSPDFSWQQIQTIPTDYTMSYHTILYHIIPNPPKFKIAITLFIFLTYELNILHGSRSRQYLQTIPCHTIPYYTIIYYIIPNSPKFKIAITQSCFEPGGPHFAQQQIQTIPTDYYHVISYHTILYHIILYYTKQPHI